VGIISTLLEKRSTLANPSGWLKEALLSSPSATGKKVDPQTALTHTAVYACVRILAETVASLPLPVYRRLSPRGKERAYDHYLYEILHDRPNEEMTSFTFRETAMGHLALWGNFYAEIEYDRAGRVRGLWPLRPDKTWPERKNKNGEIEYKTILPDGTQVILPAYRVFHIPGLSFDGLVGYSPIRLAREAIGLGLAAEEYGARFFGNGAKPGGVLEHPGNLSEEAQARLRKSWEEMHQGLSKTHRIAILEEGMQYKQIGIPPEEAQFLETRKFQVTEIARFFRVPPHMLADLERATFSNIEHQSIDFVVHTIRPWLVRWEQAINNKLFGREGRKQYFAEFVVDGLLRGDIESRYKAYAIGRQWGWLSADDVREMENMNPLPDGQGNIYFVPMNMIPADQARIENGQEVNEEDNGQDGTNGEGRTIQKKALERRQRRAAEIRWSLNRSFKRLLKDALTRVIRREEADVMRQARKQLQSRDIDQFLAWISDFYRQHEEYFRRQVLPVLLSMAEAVQSGIADEVGAEAGMTPELEEFVRGYEMFMNRRHTGGSIERLRKAIERAVAENVDIVEELQDEFDSWYEDRIESETDENIVRASNAIARFVYAAVGVTILRWVAENNACDFCTELDGKTAGVHSSFVQAGEEFEANGKTIQPSSNIGHPPLHRGCNCTIVAGS
jgi:HK97 family phage portal protein